MTYKTYILLSLKNNKTYVGHTNDLSNRLKEHNSGESDYTKRFKPWEILYKGKFETEESIIREKYFKTAAGRRWIKKNLFS